jgi:cytochrome c peroxidase
MMTAPHTGIDRRVEEASMSKSGVFWWAGLCCVALAATTATRESASAAGTEDSMKVELGRRLFFDPAVGRRGRVGCAECHQPEHGFSDPRQFSDDEERRLPRHSQPAVDLAGDGFHWDGQFPTVRDLVDSRVLPAAQAAQIAATRSRERVVAATAAGHRPPRDAQIRVDGYAGGFPLEEVVAPATPVAVRIAEDGRYDEGFRLAFGDAQVTPERVSEAIDLYVRSLRTSQNALDRFVAGDAAALSAPARRGLDLFRGKAGCAQCHSLDVSEGCAALTDHRFHDTGVAFRATAKVSTRRGVSDLDTGRAGATFLPDDTGAFKTPSLRDVAKRAPYMHDGSFATLADVVDYYDKGGTPNAHLDLKIRPLGLSAADRADLVALLESLTGSERPGLGADGEFRKKELRVRIEELDGASAKGLTVRVVPCGDRLLGTDEMPRPFDVVTDGEGAAVVPMPKATHVRLEADGVALGLSRPIPDWVATATLVATPRTVVSVRVRRLASSGTLPLVIQATDAGLETCGCSVRSKSQQWTLTRLRALSPEEAVYQVDGAPSGRRVTVRLTQGASEAELGVAEIDLSGGASETIDLDRAESLHPNDLRIASGVVNAKRK